MELLREDQVRPELGERVFRHGVFGPFVLWCFLAAPLAVGFVLRAELTRGAGALPWFVWLLLGPVVLLGGLLYSLCLVASAQVVSRALRPTNWLLRVSAKGLVLKLRSFQNAHFPTDGPTVARIPWSELAAARRVRESVEHDLVRRGQTVTSWLELELSHAQDSEELARVLAHERERPAPQSSFLGIKSRTRFGHVPVFVARPGVVRVDWLGRGVLRALAAHVTLGQTQKLDLAVAPDGKTPLELDTRLRELWRRGERIGAMSLARRELGLSLTDAREHVERLGREAA
ncbi:MAG: hypothetical protein HOP15_08590 [Planctomycetes bacterium]|nr:hypothetical protein [Planctomycetota bacterium]